MEFELNGKKRRVHLEPTTHTPSGTANLTNLCQVKITLQLDKRLLDQIEDKNSIQSNKVQSNEIKER
jgi:hypothetical protein